MSYIIFKKYYGHSGHVGDHVDNCKLGVFHQDASFSGDLHDSRSTSGGVLCILGDRTFVSASWVFLKQTAVSQSNTEAEVSLDAGLRLAAWPVSFLVLGMCC